jgi:hypothetical protein
MKKANFVNSLVVRHNSGDHVCQVLMKIGTLVAF